MNCVIIAGGRGTRLGSLTNNIPKPAIEVGGKPIIRHLIDNLKAVGFDDIIVNMRYLYEELQKAIGDDETIRYYYQPSDDYGTASILTDLDKKKWLEEEFMVVNGDTLTNVDYKDLIETHLSNTLLATVFTMDTAVHSAGTYVFDREVLKYIGKKMDIPQLIEKLSDDWGLVGTYMEIPGLSRIFYLDCGTPEGLEKARRRYETPA